MVDIFLLTAPIFEEEIKEEVWCCDGNKSLGSDGFNLHFIKECWDVVKDDIVNFVLGVSDYFNISL